MSQGGTNEKRKHREPRGSGRNSSGTPGGGVVFTSCQQLTTTEPETARHTVTFDSKGGTEIASVTVDDGKTVAEPAKPAKNGYDFGGWQNEGADYTFTDPVKSDLTLTAKWNVKTYTITYELNGGTNSSDNPATYTIESEEITLKDPTGPAAAPVFQGWYSDKEFQNRVNPAVIAKGSTDDKTFYARFGAEALKEFTVTFNVVAEANGTVLGTDSTKVNDGDKISNAQLEAAKGKIASLGEYEYDGIYTDAALATAFDTSAKITADTTLYVKVKAVQKFTVTFDSDGGSAVASVTVKSGEKAEKPADPAKDGYTFKGWLLGDAEYKFDTPVTGDITLKAKWEANKNEPEPTPVEPTVATIMAAVKNEDGTFSLPDGTYQPTFDGRNPILIVTMPESVSMESGDSVKLTGTVTFDDKTVYKQFYLQTNGMSGTPIFGWNMVAEWNDTGLKGLKKDLSVTQKIESDYSFDSCKFVFSNPLTEGDTTCPTFTLKDVKIKYVEYVAPVGGVIKYTDDITIAKNYDYTSKDFTNFQVIIPAIPDETLSSGKTISVTFKATASRALTTIQGNFVDNTEAASWWKVLNDPSDVKVFSSETASTDIDSTCQFTVSADATAEGAAKFVIYVNGAEDEEEIKLTNVDIGIKID